MSREEREDDARTTRSTRRDTQSTDRLDPGGAARGDPINPDWRGTRVTGRSRRPRGMPSTREEFVLWLQFGGWRVLLAVIGLAAVLIGLIYITRTPRSLPVPRTPTPEIADSSQFPPLLPTVTPGSFTSTVTFTPTAVIGGGTGATAGGARFKVVNTGAEGLFLRPDHNTNNPPVKTLPDGAIVTIVGEDFVGPDRVWKHVQDAEGAEGWVAMDYLQAAP